jgi:hypothetical protein
LITGPRGVYVGDDDPWFCWHWLHGVSAEEQ